MNAEHLRGSFGGTLGRMLFTAGMVALTPSRVEGGACACAHTTAMCLPYEASPGALAPEEACVYLVNVFGTDLKHLEKQFKEEAHFVNYVVDKDAHPNGDVNYARFLQPIPTHTEDERLSSDGIVLMRAYAGGAPLPLAKLGSLRLKVAGTSQPVDGSHVAVVPMRNFLSKAELGDLVEIEVMKNDKPVASRHSWFRPRSGFVVDYAVLGFAFSWPSWEFRGSPESSVVPAMVELTYRYYKPNGQFYVFSGVGIGPNFVLDDATKDGQKKSGSTAVNGLVAAGIINLNGFQVGFGSRWAWSESRVDPMITLSVTEALARGLNLTGKFPDALSGDTRR